VCFTKGEKKGKNGKNGVDYKIHPMSFFDVLFHLLHLIAPAVVVAVVLAVVGPQLVPKGPKSTHTATILGINIPLGIAILLLGLAVFGHDGQIATYGLLVAVQAGVQLAFGRGLE
jgi:hypothetical protein